MKNFKPSELPANTVIDTGKGEYIKRVEGYWEDTFSGCGCCVDRERIADDGCDDIHKRYELGITTSMTSDDYFEHFKIIALPVSVSEKLAGWLDGIDADLDLAQAINEVNSNEKA